MIHYHGTPIGGERQAVGKVLLGRHALVSYAYPEDIEAVAEACQSFILDSGTYTAWKQGRELDIPGYLRWAWKWGRLPNCDFSLIMDLINGNEEENDRLIEEWPPGLRGCPVWHLHESLDRLRRLAEEWPVVAVGSSGQWPNPGTRKWHDRMREAMATVCDVDGIPVSRLHGLRMLNAEIVKLYPFSSADSTNAAQNGSRTAKRMNAARWVGVERNMQSVELAQSASSWNCERQLYLQDPELLELH